MAQDQPKAQVSGGGEALGPHAVQRRWLDAARGKPIQVRPLDGKGVGGILLAHDTYCLSIKQPEMVEPILAFKQAIAVLLRSEEQVQP